MCPLFLRFLMNSYCKQQMRVKWNGTISNTFSTSNGVKQGGVLSPILLNVYLDELIKMLSEQELGCRLHGQFVGAFIYVDDVTLLAPTSTALNVMLETCSNFVHCYDLQFNSSVAIALSTIAITHLYIISMQIAIMSIVKPCLHITMK